jgi:hypothetical protein
MGKSVEAACRNYEFQLVNGMHPRSVTLSVSEQVERYRQGAVRLRALLPHIRAVLERTDLLRIEYPFYYGPSQRMAKVCRRFFPGATRQNELQLVMDLAQAKGLRRDVLERLAVMVDCQVDTVCV